MTVVTVNCFIFCRNNKFRPPKCTFLIRFFLFLKLNRQRTPKLTYRVPAALWTVSGVATALERPCERCCAFWIVFSYLFLITGVKSGSLIILLSKILGIWHTNTHAHTRTHIYIYIYIYTHTYIYILRQWPTLYTLALFYNTFINSSTCFEHYMLIIRRLNCIDAAGIVLWKQVSCLGLLEYSFLHILLILDNSVVFRWRYQMLHQYNSTSWLWAHNARNM